MGEKLPFNFGESPSYSSPQVVTKPNWIKCKLPSELSTVQPDQILHGILYQGCKLILMAGSKSFKTWTLMDLAYCVGNGLLWWQTHTKQCPVVYLDFELLEYDFQFRIRKIQEAHGKGDIDVVRRIGLKGKILSADHWAWIHEEILEAKGGLILCDPTYKMLCGRDENSAGDISQVTAIFDQITETTGAACGYAQHFSKGNQAGKESIDRGAGSGVWARDADAILVMTPHKEGDGYLVVEHTLRSFPRIDPFVVRWNLPLFERESQLNPDDLKQPGGRGVSFVVDDLVKCLGDQDLTTKELLRMFTEEVGGSKGTFYALLKEAAKTDRIFKSKIDQKWERVKNVGLSPSPNP